MGRDYPSVEIEASPTQFQPTRPYGARRTSTEQPRSGSRFQPTRPYGARQGVEALCHVVLDVSTHAPLWGATQTYTQDHSHLIVSTHAPLWGATLPDGRRQNLSMFQPTRPYGARPRRGKSAPKARRVSTHAPLWGATRGILRAVLRVGVSTHAPLWGATARAQGAPRPWRRFNPRAPMGRDHGCRNTVRRAGCFNPRAPMGRDARSAFEIGSPL